MPAYGHNPTPVYPSAARWAGEQGMVMLRVLVDAEGNPKQIQIEHSSGFPRLDRAAKAAVSQWRFKPGSRDGQPAAMWVRVPIRFYLEDDS